MNELPIKISKSKKDLDISYWFRFRPLFDCFYSLIFYTNTLQRCYIAWKSNFFLIKSSFLQIDIQKKFVQLVEDLMYCLDVAFSLVFSVDEDIIQIYYDKNIKLFRKDLINIALKWCRSISQFKRYYLIFEVTYLICKTVFHSFFLQILIRW